MTSFAECVYVRLAEERQCWAQILSHHPTQRHTPAPCCTYEEQHVKHEHFILNKFIVRG